MNLNGRSMKWGNLFIMYRASITRILRNIELINEENLEELFKIWNIGVMASAEDEDTIKLYLYCRIKTTKRS